MTFSNHGILNAKSAKPDGEGAWRLRIGKWDCDELSFCIADGSTDAMFGLSLEDDQAFVNNITASRKEWYELFCAVLNDPPRKPRSETLVVEFSRLDSGVYRCVVTEEGSPATVTIEASRVSASVNGVHASHQEWKSTLLRLLLDGEMILQSDEVRT